MRILTALVAPLALATATLIAVALPTGSSAAAGTVLVTLTRTAPASEATTLRSSGAKLVDERLRLWSLDAGTAADLVPRLRARGHLGIAQPSVRYTLLATTSPDPLASGEWWRTSIGAVGLDPPGPGVPITIVDNGVDVNHPDFSGRTIELLNKQAPTSAGGTHGTMVASLIGASTNGVGFTGLYPRAVIRAWDAAPRSPELESADVVEGILTAARAGRGVINLSLGGPNDLALDLAITEAESLGSLIVAASGNSGETDNALSYPASLPRVLTVAATTQNDQVASFSSRSKYVDVAAPGQAVQVAQTLRDTTTDQPVRSWTSADGTSFAAPLVSGAAAWLWTARPELTADQVAEILRRSARDIGPPGRDELSGFGIIDLKAALAMKAPVKDQAEPNDDVDEVSPDGDRAFSTFGTLTTVKRSKAKLSARVDAYEDPRDVFRIWLPANKTTTATITSSTDNDLALFRATTPSVVGRFVSGYRIARTQTRGKKDVLSYVNRGKGRWAYLVVSLPAGVLDATYSLQLSSR